MSNFDLEKWIIIICLVLLPVPGYWVYTLNKQIDSAEYSIKVAKQSKGPISNVYGLQRRIDDTKKNLRQQGGAATKAGSYFETRMTNASRGSVALPREIISVKQRPAVTQRGRKGKAGYKDISVDIKFAGGKKLLPRSFINAFIVNSESQSPIWKLRSLHIQNKEFGGNRGKVLPQMEMSDEWLVRKMVFARRAPLKKGEKK